jgi:hypothetical protein
MSKTRGEQVLWFATGLCFGCWDDAFEYFHEDFRKANNLTKGNALPNVYNFSCSVKSCPWRSKLQSSPDGSSVSYYIISVEDHRGHHIHPLNIAAMDNNNNLRGLTTEQKECIDKLFKEQYKTTKQVLRKMQKVCFIFLFFCHN